MKQFLFATSIVMALAAPASSQTLAIADTLGKGKTAVFVAENALLITGFTTASLSMGQLWHGVTDRVDLFVGASEIVLLGQKQTAAAFGGNVNLLKSNHLSISTLHSLSLPLHRRDDACHALWFAAVVVSRNFTGFSLYSGYAATVPLGKASDKLFTPPSPVHNVPLGIMIPRGNWAVFAEYSLGGAQRAASLGVAYTFGP